MATPSLTSAGLWCDTVTVSSSQTLTLKIGIWTKITNSSSDTVIIKFNGSVFTSSSSFLPGGFSLGSGKSMLVVRAL